MEQMFELTGFQIDSLENRRPAHGAHPGSRDRATAVAGGDEVSGIARPDVVNLGEVHYILLKHVGEPRARHYLKVLQNVATMVEADAVQALAAAEMKHKFKLGYADSFAATLALTSKATLVSADPEFEKLGKALKWVRLPRLAP
jgi:predicted nucleic acid-binding protein